MAKEDWANRHTHETEYYRALKRVARDITEHLKAANEKGTPVDLFQLIAMRYTDLITPWAESLVRRIGGRIERQNKAVFYRNARDMGVGIRELMDDRRGVGGVVKLWMDIQMPLIKSIPTDAAARVHDAAMKSLSSGNRSTAIDEALMTTGHVSASRARLIARTETARAQSMLTQARAEQIGSEKYIWRTTKDHDVRPSHKEMEGKVCRWDTLPKLSDGTTCSPGTIYRCRCYAEPIFPQ